MLYASRMKAIGFFGGTFAPIHNGHLRLALELRDLLALDEVRVCPSARPPHRAAPGASAERRMDWVRLALADEPGLVADDRELRRAARLGVPSYTVDTLAELRDEQPSARLCLLIGEDAANGLHGWHRWQALLDYAHLVVVSRPDAEPAPTAAVAAFLAPRRAREVGDLQDTLQGRWLPVTVPGLQISSSRIRRLLHEGRSIRGLVPDAVIHSLQPEDVRALTIEETVTHD